MWFGSLRLIRSSFFFERNGSDSKSCWGTIKVIEWEFWFDEPHSTDKYLSQVDSSTVGEFFRTFSWDLSWISMWQLLTMMAIFHHQLRPWWCSMWIWASKNNHENCWSWIVIILMCPVASFGDLKLADHISMRLNFEVFTSLLSSFSRMFSVQLAVECIEPWKIIHRSS